ncbi:hypothetical protein HMPREF9098_1667 [Kingella denitrificans ATCC 33394]|uniref:Uncharacterized protein n=1 Tax=Kingella denitrificans ATCC 33394 TaxID=888741 RepID=F0F0N2_9NEIS|nr:hypothetical protein HMPREF9098_1667 [Kingella denitrificans ATCC 33394]
MIFPFGLWRVVIEAQISCAKQLYIYTHLQENIHELTFTVPSNGLKFPFLAILITQ